MEQLPRIATVPTRIGILALPLRNGHFEERRLFERMSVLGKSTISLFVFSPSDVHSTKKQPIHAFSYDVQTRRWSRSWQPWPDVVFDRCRLQHLPQFAQLPRWRKRYPHLTWMNRPLGHKWTVHRRLSQDSFIRPYLPDTVRWRESPLKHPVLFIKLLRGTGGRGILCLRHQPHIAPTAYEISGRNQQRRIIPTVIRPTWAATCLHIKQLLGTTPCLLQQGINVTLPDGRVHDLRLLIQKNNFGTWEVTGIAGRIGRPQSVTANLHGGGTARSFERTLALNGHAPKQRARIWTTMHRLATRIARSLENYNGGLCELAIDFAVDRQGKPWVLEVNPKPSRDIFRRIGARETYRLSVLRPLLYGQWLALQRANASPSQDALIDPP